VQQVTTVEGARPFTKEEIARMRNAPYKSPGTSAFPPATNGAKPR
jgi:hypothetical protein